MLTIFGFFLCSALAVTILGYAIASFGTPRSSFIRYFICVTGGTSFVMAVWCYGALILDLGLVLGSLAMPWMIHWLTVGLKFKSSGKLGFL